MKPLVLIILDGWGKAPSGKGNALSQMHTHYIDSLLSTFPHTELKAAGSAVGLPDGEPGNSETGHMNLGAGRIVEQDLLRISSSIKNKSFFANNEFQSAIDHCQKNNSSMHIMGLLSDTGVHASFHHLGALAQITHESNLPRVFLHLFTDGRDSPPQSAIQTLKNIYKQYPTLEKIPIATVMGRYYAMDRDRRWDRTQKAYDALTDNAPCEADSFIDAIQKAYARSESDEFVIPTCIKNTPRITRGDSVIFYNYRIDRPRQLTQAFCIPDFEQKYFSDTYSDNFSHISDTDNRAHPFTRKVVVSNIFFVTMTEYRRDLSCHVAYPPIVIRENLSKIISDNLLKQLHIAESEKERFVTYYFNGMTGMKYPGEDDKTVASSNVDTYDQEPEMKARQITDDVIEAIDAETYDFIVLNYANPDMVGHSGNIEKTILGCETVDRETQKLVNHILSKNGTCIITSDHGHAEEMLNSDGSMLTEHTDNVVPLIVCSNKFKNDPIELPRGVLADVAPTILSLFTIQPSKEMTGKNLLSGVL
jgi:2,3-bisphosphoglycerate-independent phosphoglycerate mutase